MTYSRDNRDNRDNNRGDRGGNRGGRPGQSGNYRRNNNNRGGGRYNNNRGGGRYNNRNNQPSVPENSTFNSLTDKAITELADNKFRVLPLGGQGELGRNLWIYEKGEEILLIDAGIGFVPHGLKGGVELLLPNIEYLQKNKEKIQALAITNPSLEFSGDAIRIIKELEISEIYAPSLFNEFYKDELDSNIRVTNLESKGIYKIGNEFSLQALNMSSSTYDVFSFVIETNIAKAFHIGSFKIDHNSVNTQFSTDLTEIVNNVTKKGIDILISGSSNVEYKEYSPSESNIQPKLDTILEQTKGLTVALTCINYHHRIQAFFNAAIKSNRKVCLYSSELQSIVNAGKTLGYWKNIDQVQFIDINEIKSQKKRDETLVLITEHEADILEPLYRLADKEDLSLPLEAGDAVIVSANQPLGTTRLLARSIDKLFEQGVQVIGGPNAGVHVPTAAGQEELKFIYNIARPKYFIPSTGEVRQLVLHAEIMAECGMNPEKILIIDNGNSVDYDSETSTAEITGRVNANPIFFSKSADGAMDNKSLEDRQMLAQEGMVTIAIAIDSKNMEMVSDAKIQTIGNGFHGSDDWTELENILHSDIAKVVKKALSAGHKDISLLRRLVHEIFNKKSREKIGMFNPILTIVIQDIAQAPVAA